MAFIFRTTTHTTALATLALSAVLVSAPPAAAGVRQHRFKVSLSLSYQSSRQETSTCTDAQYNEYPDLLTGTRRVVVTTVRPVTVVSDRYGGGRFLTERGGPVGRLRVTETRSTAEAPAPNCIPPDPPPPPQRCGTRSITAGVSFRLTVSKVGFDFEQPNWIRETSVGGYDECQQPQGYAAVQFPGVTLSIDGVRTSFSQVRVLSHRRRRTVLRFSREGSASDPQNPPSSERAMLKYAITFFRVR